MKYSISDFYTYNFFPEIDLDKIKSIFGTRNMLVSTKGCYILQGKNNIFIITDKHKVKVNFI